MSDINKSQTDYWNSAPGRKWVTHEAVLDSLMAPVLTRLLEHAHLRFGERVLDIGCGTGTSTWEAAHKVGVLGHVTGLDISEQLLARARARSSDTLNVDFVVADAQDHDLARDPCDVIISRFGVMFFSDPIASFANMKKALRPQGRLVLACWGPVAGNPWFSIPRDAAVARLGTPSPTDPNAPGPLAFQDPERVVGMMKTAGLEQARCTTEVITMTPHVGLVEAAKVACQVGPAARILTEFGGDDLDHNAIEATIAKGLARYDTSKGLAIPATIHFYHAARHAP